ncbi:19549_t:CDS:2 [Gigaspora margarita]|uniref:19549_t:CDS:1 n=1 Tax=Gigaspora margarita TaxID=4874 RepID=A0ABN7VBK3_GIGMA|nr:19549_t:CDS:2 [Gigaspora margarita]
MGWPSSENNVNFSSRSKKLQKISQLEQALETESNQHLSQSSDDTESSISFNLSQEQSETTIMSSQSKAYRQITPEQSLKVPEIEILINNADKFTNKKPSASWVWGYMKKDKLKNEITCDIVTILDGNEKKCDKRFSQAIIELDKSTLTIPSILSKVDSHNPAKQSKLTSHDSELESDDSIEFMPKQSTISPQFTSQIQLTLPMQSTQSTSVQSQSKKGQTTVDPIHDVKTRWNSTFFVLKRLLHLQDAVKQLARSLYHYSELQQRKDRQNLSKKLLLETEWEELNELKLLLEPFTQTTKLIGGAQYPTLGMMLPTISLLLSHLHQMNESLSSSIILDVCQKIEDSILNRWKEPSNEAYIASYLDPHFKKMSFTNKNKKKVFRTQYQK